MEKLDVTKVIEFLDVASQATSDNDYAEFECPICGKYAVARKASLNGHIHAACAGCGMDLMQ